MAYSYGKKSLGQLIGIHPVMAAVAIRAIDLCESDFSIFDGVRNIQQQQFMVSNGTSKTMDSYHLYGLAYDLVPYIDGRNYWDSKDPVMQSKIDKAFADIKKAMLQAMDEFGIKLDNGFDLWGWDIPHWQWTGMKQNYDVRLLKHDLLCA